jgi:hypothetical protein
MNLCSFFRSSWKKDVSAKLTMIIGKLDEIINNIHTEGVTMTVELDALQQQVSENTSLEQSAIQLIEGIADQLEAVKDDPEKISALTASLKGTATALAAAIAANTPVEPTPEPSPEPEPEPVPEPEG